VLEKISNDPVTTSPYVNYIPENKH